MRRRDGEGEGFKKGHGKNEFEVLMQCGNMHMGLFGKCRVKMWCLQMHRANDLKEDVFWGLF